MDLPDDIPEPDPDAWYLDHDHLDFDRPDPVPADETITDPYYRVDDQTWDETVLALLMSEIDEPYGLDHP